MNNSNSLERLSSNFRNEKKYLLKNNLNSWEKLGKLTDSEINYICTKDTLCTGSRLKKIRAIGILIIKLNININQAQLLLHCGVSSLKSLSILNPHNLERKIGRLERSLNVRTQTSTNLHLIKSWINKAKNSI